MSLNALFLVSLLEPPNGLKGITYEKDQKLFKQANFNNLRVKSTHTILFDESGDKHVRTLAALLGDGLQVHLRIQVFIDSEEAGTAEIHSLVENNPEIDVPMQMAEDIIDTVLSAMGEDGFEAILSEFELIDVSIVDDIFFYHGKENRYLN